MSPQSRYREAFSAVRSLLQQEDPHRLMTMYAGDRFDGEIYGYEATTIIQGVRSDPSPVRVEELLALIATKARREVNAEATKTAAKKITEVLSAL